METTITIGTKIPRSKLGELRSLAAELEYPSLSDMVRAAILAYLEVQQERLKNGQRLTALQDSIYAQAKACPVAHLLFVEGTSKVNAPVDRTATTPSWGRWRRRNT